MICSFFLDHRDIAKETLACALIRFPGLLEPLLKKMGVSMSNAVWQSVLGSVVFANAKRIDEHGALQHVLDIYVSRNHSIWKVNDVQSFLLESAQLAVSSSRLNAANSQVLELPPSLIKYKRAYPGGMLTILSTNDVYSTNAFYRLFR